MTSVYRKAAFAVYLLFAIALVYKPIDAVSIGITDASEYSIAAQNLVAGEGLTVTVHGERHPTRYLPGFSTLFLAPIYWLTDGPPERAILAVQLAGVGLFLLVWFLCTTLVQGWNGIAAAFVSAPLIRHMPSFERTIETLMSDVPIVAASFLACAAFVATWRKPSMRTCVIGGAAVALATSMRLTCLALCGPFFLLLFVSLWRRRDYRHLVAFCVPFGGGVAALLAFNWAVFGGPLHTGYHYWLTANGYSLGFANLELASDAMLRPFGPRLHIHPVPGSAIAMNSLLLLPVLAGGLGWMFARERLKRLTPLLLFMLVALVPTQAFFLLYPFPESRFSLLAHAMVLVLGVCMTTLLLPKERGQWLSGGVALAGLVVGLLCHPWSQLDDRPMIKTVFEKAHAALPRDAIVVGALPEMLGIRGIIRDTERQYVPLRVLRSFETWTVGKYGEERRPIGIPSVQTDPDQITRALQNGRSVYFLCYDARWNRYEAERDAVLARYDHEVVFKIRQIDAMYELKLRDR